MIPIIIFEFTAVIALKKLAAGFPLA